MRVVDMIHKKRNGFSLSKQEIDFIIKGYTDGSIPDYQIAALLMAIYYKGMNEQEVSDLTIAMVNSGDTIDLSPIKGIKVDKHSTGGVGDKTSLILGPLVASVGVPVAKMSGRGLGHTGGTIDKLESIPGFKIELTAGQFIQNVNRIKIAIVGQSGNLTPADKKLYALRDVTATVDSIPLIASSIMSKKIASGADAIVLDVKTGSGAFMKSLSDAKQLARVMVEIGKRLNRKTIAVISDMNQPLGYEIGNALEVKEAIETLQGRGPDDLTEICLTLSSHMAVLGGIYHDFEEAHRELEKILRSGKALETMKQFIEAQGGLPDVVENVQKLPQARSQVEVIASESGYVHFIDAESVGLAVMLLGAGRKIKDEKIDYAVGITLKKKVGDQVRKGDIFAILHTNNRDHRESEELLRHAYKVKAEKPDQLPLIYDIIK
ncbi:pyrimidine-nucleoside phosphorylase [Aneurinibacillus terranovensis]|uniref:pyrimidine-nucleoside phosphorylase n=1 Tax=Aneurinibacillus terranovensis TaxID=278991 RepID=UPI00040ECA5D|nr:pyrimidine-nucleoside phosphorylase [Aneurinibacillus terranovensis]